MYTGGGSMSAPEHISFEIEEDKVITANIEGQKVYFTPLEAIDLINQLSGVLLAYERCRQ